MEMDSPLTMTGLIATIFGMLFALAAFITSRRKQAHRTAQLNPKADETLDPVAEDQDHGADPQQASANATEDSKKRPLAVFKQVGPQGAEVTPVAQYADDEYIWE